DLRGLRVSISCRSAEYASTARSGGKGAVLPPYWWTAPFPYIRSCEYLYPGEYSRMGNSYDYGSIVPVVIAGGSGTRLWPISRDTMPKQFAEVLGKGFSTFQNTLLRVSG